MFMIIEGQTVDFNDFCKKVITKVYGEEALFSLDEYDKLWAIIEETVSYLKGDNNA